MFYCYRLSFFDMQGVHKVFGQFKKFIAKALDEISCIDLFYINQCLLKFLVKIKFSVSDKIFMCLINVLINPCKMATLEEKSQFSQMFLVIHF